MADVFSRAKRSLIMSRIRSRGNKTTELRFILLLRKYKIRGWRRGVNLPGQPDFTFQAQKIVVFVDGDFWHGNPRTFRFPSTNSKYWREKILRNRRRDSAINKALKLRGWTVVRVWESSLLKAEKRIARQLLAQLMS